MRRDADFPPVRHPAPGRRITGAAPPPQLWFDAPDPGRYGLPASLVVHGAIATAALVAWQTAPLREPPQVVPVEIVADVPSGIGTASRTQAATATDEPEGAGPAPAAATPAGAGPSPAPPPETEAGAEAAPPPPAPPPPAPPPPAPSPPPAPPPPPARKAEAPRPAATAARPAPRPPPSAPPPPPPRQQTQPRTPPPPATGAAAASQPRQPPRPRETAAPAPAGTSGTSGSVADDFAWDSAAASQRASGADSGGRRAPQMKGQDGVRNGSAPGAGAVLGGDLGAAILAQVRDCWAVPENPEAARMVVTVRFRLTPEGRLRGDVDLVAPRTRPNGNTPATVAVDRALGAVRQCVAADGRSGYQLPRDRYDEWSDITINIGLRTMQP